MEIYEVKYIVVKWEVMTNSVEETDWKIDISIMSEK